MPLLPEFPISGDDYTVGTITTTAGKKEFVTKDAYLNSFGAVRPGDHVYISTTGKILVIGSITGENSGTFTDACPDDCAVKDLPLRVVYKTASSRVQGRIAMLLERLSKGYLAALSEITAKEGQIFQTTNVPGEFKAIDLNTDNIKETDTHKIMTADEREKLANFKDQVLDQMVDGSIIMCPFAKPAYRMVIANGAILSRKDYARLWNVVSQRGTVSETSWQNGNWGAYSTGDGSTTFRIPNLSGEFPRFLDTVGNVDPNRKFGSLQGDAIRNITGAGVFHGSNAGTNLAALTGVFDGNILNAYKNGGDYTNTGATSFGSFVFDASRIVPTAQENRPRNIALLPCIRY